MRPLHEKNELDCLWSAVRAFSGGRPVRSEDWLDMIRAQKCCLCPAPSPSQAHHLFGSYGKLKTSDLFTVPVCQDCHDTKAEDPRHRHALLLFWIQLVHEYLRLEFDRRILYTESHPTGSDLPTKL